MHQDDEATGKEGAMRMVRDMLKRRWRGKEKTRRDTDQDDNHEDDGSEGENVKTCRGGQ